MMDIRRDQLSTAVSSKFSREELEHALRCVLYEMVVLALALVQLKNRGEKLKDQTSGQTLPFGKEADSPAGLRDVRTLRQGNPHCAGSDMPVIIVQWKIVPKGKHHEADQGAD